MGAESGQLRLSRRRNRISRGGSETKRDAHCVALAPRCEPVWEGKAPRTCTGNKQMAAVSRLHSRRECEPKELLVCAGAGVGL
jgi:hypothetical protein